MAKRPAITPINLGEVTIPLNNNFEAIAAQFDNTISRDGSTPNEMNSDLDMNSNDILNVGLLEAQDVLVGGSPLPSVPELQEAVQAAQEAAQDALNAANTAGEVLVEVEDIKEEVEELVNNVVSLTSRRSVDTHVGDGTQTVFSLTESPASKDFTQVFVGGVYQLKDDYEVTATSIIFNTAPPIGVPIEINTLEQNAVGLVSSEYVTYEDTTVKAALDDLYENGGGGGGGGVTMEQVMEQINLLADEISDEYQPLIQPARTIPYATDGRTLTRFRKKVGLTQLGVGTHQLRVAFVGDSWSEIPTIPTRMVNFFGEKFLPAGSSFQAARAQQQWGGNVLTISAGWTRIDASSTPTTTSPYGWGPDGQTLHTTGTNETLNFSSVPGNEIRIYTRRNGGRWRYRVNGGSWVTVTESANNQSLNITVIAGLANANHTLDINTTGNTGRVAFVGLQNVRAGRVAVQKVGNSGLTARHFSNFIASQTDTWADLSPDLVICQIGTNDYRTTYSPPSVYIEGIQAMVNTIRAASPGVGFILVIPPQSNGTTITPLSQYRDALYDFCLANDCEFLNLLDTWGPYDATLWADSVHLNFSGAAVEVNQMNHKLLGL